MLNLIFRVALAAEEATSATHSANPEPNLLVALGIDWKMFIAQLVNFIIVLLILWRFAYRPLIKILNERSNKIDQSLKSATEIEQRLATVKLEQDALIQTARDQAQDLIKQAENEASSSKKRLLAETDQEIAKKLSDLKIALAEEKNKTLKEASNEVANLVIQVVEKILPSIVKPEVDRQLIQQLLKK